MKQNLILRIFCAMLFTVFISINAFAVNIIAEVKSPGEEITVQLLLDQNSALYYRATKGPDQIILESALGLNTAVGNFSTGLTFGGSSVNTVNESYALPSGKKSVYQNVYNELTATFNNSGKDFQVIFRVYKDGIAFRYALSGSGSAVIHAESSECNIAVKSQIFSQTYSRDYKNIIEESDWERVSCLKYMSLPLLVKSNTEYMLISEAMVNGGYSAARLIANEETQALRYQPAGTVTVSLPFLSPWRTITTGSLADIVESTMMENLNLPTSITDLSWIKPGRAAWNYGGEDTSGYLTIGNIRNYIDWAEEMGWEYFTLDRGWQNNSAFTLDQVISYANSKKIGVFVWLNQNKLPATENELRNILLNWKNKGVKGVKVDFWENDSQTTMKKYDLLLRLTSEMKLLVNLHSCTKPTGLRRTWPHLLTSEAVLGNVYYANSPDVVTAAHNINSAIIRGPLGSTDYSPVDFADKKGKILHGTTWAHQLALSVVFESGIQHIADAPVNLKYHISNSFLKTLPASWDDTKCIAAAMDNSVTIARRKGDNWYVASLSNESDTMETHLNFLTPGKMYNAYIYKDGNCRSEIQFECKENLTSQDKITLQMAPGGGFVVLLSPLGDYIKPRHMKYEAESGDNTIPFGVSIKSDNDSLCSNSKYVAGIGNGRSFTFKKINVQHSGTYALTFYYTAETSRTAYIKVNDKDVTLREYSFNGTGFNSGSGLGYKTVLVDLIAATENSIEFGNYTGMAPNLDRIVISESGLLATEVEQLVEGNEYGRIYAIDKNIVIEQEGATKYQVYNHIGQLIATGSFSGGRHSVPVAYQGVYIVRINTRNGELSEKVFIK